jgi:NAD-dependent deacetylase
VDLPPPLREALRDLRSLGVVTGAGISAESGIPTYRGKGGVYDDPAEGDRTVEALSGDTLRRDPARTWRTIADLARRSLGARPNAGHEALVRLERGLERFVLLTQNVDGLHQMAGSRDPIDLHGSVRETRCMVCGATGRMEREEAARLEGVPACDRCGGDLRPDVVLFGEVLPDAKVQRLYAEFLLDPPEAVWIVGTTALFAYIVEPVLVAARRGALTVEVNPERTDLSDLVDFHLAAPAGLALPALASAVLGA